MPEAVFEGNYSIDSGTLEPRIYVWDDALPSTQLKNVVILTNFDVTTQNVIPDFPYTGTWYDLMDPTSNTTLNVTNTSTAIAIEAGQFKIYGNQAPTLSTKNYENSLNAIVYPNPASTSFQINTSLKEVSIYDITGKRIKTFKDNFKIGHSFDISKISKGIYILKLNNLGITDTKKLIIN